MTGTRDDALVALGIAAADEGRASAHGTAVALDGAGLLILGPSGSGKSGTAASLMALGAGLVADDLVVLAAVEGGVALSAPATAPAAIELRGIGITPVSLAGPAPLRGVLWLGPSPARLPEPEKVSLLGHAVPIARHPAHSDLPAKAALWLRSLG